MKMRLYIEVPLFYILSASFFKNVFCADRIQNCDGADNLPLVGKNFQVPSNLFAKPGEYVSLKFDLLAREKIPEDLMIDVSLQRKFGFLWLPLPCFAGKVGSCPYNLPCKSLQSIGLPCELTPNVYHVDQKVRIPSEIPIPHFIVDGKYSMELHIKSKSNPRKVLSCLKVDVNLK